MWAHAQPVWQETKMLNTSDISWRRCRHHIIPYSGPDSPPVDFCGSLGNLKNRPRPLASVQA